MAQKIVLHYGGTEIACELKREGSQLRLTYGAKELTAKILEQTPHFFELQINDQVQKVACHADAKGVYVHLAAGNFFIGFPKRKSKRQRSGVDSGEELTAPMPGKLLKVLVAVGDEVKKGDTLMILEAMKMEHPIRAPETGRVKTVYYQEGQRVSQGEELLELQ